MILNSKPPNELPTDFQQDRKYKDKLFEQYITKDAEQFADKQNTDFLSSLNDRAPKATSLYKPSGYMGDFDRTKSLIFNDRFSLQNASSNLLFGDKIANNGLFPVAKDFKYGSFFDDRAPKVDYRFTNDLYYGLRLEGKTEQDFILSNARLQAQGIGGDIRQLDPTTRGILQLKGELDANYLADNFTDSFIKTNFGSSKTSSAQSSKVSSPTKLSTPSSKASSPSTPTANIIETRSQINSPFGDTDFEKPKSARSSSEKSIENIVIGTARRSANPDGNKMPIAPVQENEKKGKGIEIFQRLVKSKVARSKAAVKNIHEVGKTMLAKRRLENESMGKQDEAEKRKTEVKNHLNSMISDVEAKHAREELEAIKAKKEAVIPVPEEAKDLDALNDFTKSKQIEMIAKTPSKLDKETLAAARTKAKEFIQTCQLTKVLFERDLLEGKGNKTEMVREIKSLTQIPLTATLKATNILKRIDEAQAEAKLNLKIIESRAKSGKENDTSSAKAGKRAQSAGKKRNLTPRNVNDNDFMYGEAGTSIPSERFKNIPNEV